MVEILEMNEWISVKDQMPPLEEEILAFSQEEGCKVSFFSYWDSSKKKGLWDLETGFWARASAFGYNDHVVRLEGVTHWMPLPSPPT